MIKVTKEFMEMLMSDEAFEYAGQALDQLIGNYKEIKPNNDRLDQELRAIALADIMTNLSGKLFGDNYDSLDKMMKEMKDEHMTTSAYLYCNWRVWREYKYNEKLAKSYQKICDYIDDYVFDNWPKNKVEYFVRETD